MIEIPNLEQPSYAQHELEQLQEQYNHRPDLPPAGDSAGAASPEHSYTSPFQPSAAHVLDLPIEFSETPASPFVPLPQLVHAQSPMAVDLYFLAQKAPFDPDSLYEANGHPVSNIDQIPEMDETSEHETSFLDNAQPSADTQGGFRDEPTSPSRVYENSDAFGISSGPQTHLESSASLQLSEYARELAIEPQVIEYSRAQPVRMALTSTYASPPQKTSMSGSPSQDSDPAPSLSGIIQLNSPTQSLPLAEGASAGLQPSFAVHSFATPQLLLGAHSEPSPQLPPPLSVKSSKLTLSHGEQFTQMRKALATEPKNPAEYTLHILFTQFVRHAERKLNLCLNYPLEQEHLIIELLAEGLDSHFDNIVKSLGYIAKRKPKPVIDSVMFWRKSKSEVAVMASAEVEKVLNIAKLNLDPNPDIRPSSDASAAQKQQPLPKAIGTRGKRSLSLMRSKSISKLAHRRNASASVLSVSDRGISAPLSVESSSEDHSNDEMRQKQFYEEQAANAKLTAMHAERKSLCSIYILCRVLIEVVKQATEASLEEDLGRKLEEIVYNQLKTTDPIAISESFVRLANWNLFCELLGFMSEKRFLSVSDRFIADLEKVPVTLKQTEEPRIHLLIHGMRYIKLTNYPLEKFEESAEFIQSLAKFFCNAQNNTIINAYSEVLSNLTLPLASVLTAEANHPLWIEAITQIYQKAYRLSNRPNSQASPGSLISSSGNLRAPLAADQDTSLILTTSALTVSSKELFSTNWFALIEANTFRLKPKVETALKTKFMVCISRLLWVYVNRLPDTLNNTVKKLDRLFDILFFSPAVTGKKQQWIVLDSDLINAISELIRIVAYQHFNYILDNVILRLLRSSFDGTHIEGSSPEKLMLVIKAYTLCLQDFKIGERPEFPMDKVLEDQFKQGALFETHKSLKSLFEIAKDKSFHKWNKLMLDKKGMKNISAHEEVSATFSSLLKLLDTQCGVSNWVKNEAAFSNVSRSAISASTFSFGLDFYQNSKDVYSSLFATILDACSWTVLPFISEKAGSQISQGLSYQSIVDIFVRNSVHEDSLIAAAAVSSLAKLASRKNAGSLLTLFAKIAFRITEKPGPSYDLDYFNSESFLRLLRIYVELLRCWLDQFSEDIANPSRLENGPDNDMLNGGNLSDLYQINHKAPDLTNLEPIGNKLKPYEELEWKSIITVIEEVEGNGLLFLCLDDSRKRLLAIAILKIVEQFDQSIYNSTDKKEAAPISSNSSSHGGHSRSSSKYVADEGLRLYHFIENADLFELIKPFRKELSTPEKTRLSRIKSKKGMIFKFAASDYGINSTIWFRLYPRLLDILFERCPMPVAMCRSIVCVRLVQMHELVVSFSDSFKNYTTSIFNRSFSSTPPEVLVNQWRLYLIFACCSLTSTNEQKISIPTQPNHGRKKSLPMYIQHQKITSAKSVFRMVIPLLKSYQPMVREAVIAGLSCININTCKTLTENLPDFLTDWEIASKRRDTAEDKVRIEIIHILSVITSRFKASKVLYSDDLTVANLVSLIKNVKSFLLISSIQTLPDFQRLRFYFSSFLENVFIGLKDRPDLERWFPFEARIGCFNFLQEWCGFGDAKSVLEERYNVMTEKANQLKEPATTVALLDLERKTFQLATLSCMATICSGALKQSFAVPGQTAVLSFDIKSVMVWVHEIVSSEIPKVHDIGKLALKNILSSNINNDEIYSEALRQCHNSENSVQVKRVYYTLVVDAFITDRKVESMPYEIFCISTFLIGTDCYEVRYAAINCMKHIESKYLATSELDNFTEAVCCSTMVVYKKALFDISMKLASSHAEDAFTFISYLTKYFNLVDNSTRRDILACLLPWVQTVKLSYTESEGLQAMGDTNRDNASQQQPIRGIDSPSLMILNNLFEITVKFSKVISNEIEALWVALGTNPNNFELMFDYIIRNSLKRKNSSFVSHSRQIISYLVFSKPDLSYIIDKLIANLEPRAMVPLQPLDDTITEDTGNFPYTANLANTLAPNAKESAFSLGQISIVFLVDLFRSKNDMILQHLPLLLHTSFSLMDHYFSLVQEQAVSLLLHLIHSIAPANQKSRQIKEMLRSKDHQAHLWMYDDLNNDKKSGITPKNMDLMVRNSVEIFTNAAPTLQVDWGRISLKWATTCAVRHIACRSFQVFRSLLSFLDQNMLKDMLHRLSNTVADESPDIQGFAMQILMTINAITAELDSEELIDFPQLFWSSVACLSTIHEHEFIETISMMSKFVSKIDLDAPDTISCLISTFPPKWDGKFEGLLETVMVGLRSATTLEPTFKFLDKINKLKDSDIIGSGDQRLLTVLIANLPRFLHALDLPSISPEIETTCNLISEMASLCNKAGLARILNSFAKSRFRSKKEFLVQTVSSMKTNFFPQYEAHAVVLLLSFLSNRLPWVKLETLNILKLIFPLVDLRSDEFTGVGADLVAPLLRLLLTEFAEPALEVIDECVVISGSQLDKDILRMSMGDLSMRKEYEQTAALFGIPDETGWAIPMPAVTAARARHNVHAVFATCGEPSTVVDEKRKDSFADEEIQFLMEDYYAPPPDHGDTASMGVEDPAASLSNVWATLDDFDSFFTKPSEQRALMLNHSRRKSHRNHTFSVDTKNSNSSDLTSPIDSVPQVYDKKALVILNRSLARTQSMTSFKSSLSDSYGTHGNAQQEVAAMKKSYIPFRKSKLVRPKPDPYTTPTLNGATTFDQGNSAQLSKSLAKSSPQAFNQGKVPSPQETQISIECPEHGNRFDLLLGGKKKSSLRKLN